MRRSKTRLRRLESLRRAEETSSRYRLATSVDAVGDAVATMPSPPAPLVLGELDSELLRRGIAIERLGWASFGAGMSRVELARSQEATARIVWWDAAVSLRSVARLADRADARLRARASRREQGNLDEIAIVAWRRGRRRG